jgi:hypothetical protein
MDKNLKIKVSENSYNKDSEVSNFSVTYASRKIDNSIVSHQVISALKAENNIIIEINSSLLNLSQNDGKTFISKFIASLETMKIEYKYKKTLVNAKRTLFSIGQESKKINGFELLAYIPHETWMDQEFRNIIPNIGMRYYLLTSNSDINLDIFVNLDEDEKLEQCKLVIFDHILLGSMGINTSILKKDDIIELLKK